MQRKSHLAYFLLALFLQASSAVHAQDAKSQIAAGKTSRVLYGAPPDLHDQVEKELSTLLK